MGLSSIKQSTVELADAWHADDCTVDAGGGCILHSDIKEAWIAGYESGSAEIEQWQRAMAEVVEKQTLAEAKNERLRVALRQILEDPEALILNSHRDDGCAVLGEPKKWLAIPSRWA